MDSFIATPLEWGFLLTLFPRLPYNIAMKDKELKIKVDDQFIEKVDYLQRINDFKNRSDCVRKVVEKEYNKEKEALPVFLPDWMKPCVYSKDGRCSACKILSISCNGEKWVNCEQYKITKEREKEK